MGPSLLGQSELSYLCHSPFDADSTIRQASSGLWLVDWYQNRTSPNHRFAKKTYVGAPWTIAFSLLLQSSALRGVFTRISILQSRDSCVWRVSHLLLVSSMQSLARQGLACFDNYERLAV